MLQFFEDVLDREEVKTFIGSYFEALNTIDPRDKEGSKARLESFYSEDFMSRENDWPHNRGKKGWLGYWVSSAPRYFRKFYYKEPDGFMIVDVRNGIVCCQIRQECIHIETGEIVRAYINAVDLRVKKVDGVLKIDRECWIRVPANYQTDYPQQLGEEGLPCWLYVDYSRPY